MVRIVTALIAFVTAGLLLAGSATSASAHYRHHGYGYGGHGCCGPVRPTYVYHTVHRERNVTRYHDVSTYRHVTKIHRIVHVTLIQPIVHVHSVTRYHHHTIVHVRPRYEHTAHLLPARVYVTHSSSNTYDCRCAGARYSCR